MVDAPEATRAAFRGRCLQKFGAEVRSLNWDSIEFAVGGRVETVDLKGCVERETAATFTAVLEEADSVSELITQLEEMHHAVS
jgi:proteasome accessory factor A